MKQYILTLLFLICTLDMVCGQQDWTYFQPKDQSFELSVPCDLSAGEKKIVTDIGEMHPFTWACSGTEGDPNYLYMVSYVDYPTGTLHADSVELMKTLLDESMDALLKDIHASLDYKADSPYGHHNGIIFRAMIDKNKVVVKCRMLIVDDRFYAIQVYTPMDKSLNDDINRYLNSFRLKEKNQKVIR